MLVVVVAGCNDVDEVDWFMLLRMCQIHSH